MAKLYHVYYFFFLVNLLGLKAALHNFKVFFSNYTGRQHIILFPDEFTRSMKYVRYTPFQKKTAHNRIFFRREKNKIQRIVFPVEDANKRMCAEKLRKSRTKSSMREDLQENRKSYSTKKIFKIVFTTFPVRKST